MKLIDILVQDLPGLGGWPKDKTVASHGPNNCVMFHELGVTPFVYAGLKFEGNDIVTKEEYEAELAASKPEWDGRGLPPSGVEFEYLRGDFGADEGRWVKCTMKYAGDRYCIVHLDGEGESWLKHEGAKIRPIRSEADKKRDDAVKALKGIIGGSGGPYAEVKAGEIYDAIKSGKIVID
ncbi:hypothetical protein QM128_05675 [Enterobacter hormaechei]|uniref:hypothetical protein n=1 Tax=Enterobacter hormaechei TaxID=158836 RepID=UPI00294A374E|nr:hypothetical protein [Enterobacter hormaechei]MDV5581928.1 hypothetical protein [Enterobacter hormaechei]